MSLFPFEAREIRVRLCQIAATMSVALVAGCGSSYRPVVTPINPSGPAAQPNSLAVVLSSPAPTSPGVVTILDYSGDTIMAQASIGPGPMAFSVDAGGANGYTVNSDHTLTNFPVSATQLQQKFITYTTLPITAQTVGLFTPTSGLWTADLDQNVVNVLSGSPAKFQLAIPVAATPIGVVGPSAVGQRNYAISQNNASTPVGSAIPFGVTCNNAPASVTQNGEADALEVSTFTVSARIPLGKCPVYAVQTPDARRLFVLNRGSDTVTVINTQKNTLNACTPFVNQSGRLVTCHPTLPLSTTAGLTGTNVPAVAGPVHAEYNPATEQLVVADYDGGSVSVIDVSTDIYGDDSATFGTTFTIPVGKNPASVTVLADGSRAYTADQADQTVHIINLSSHTVEKTLGVVGHPRTVASTSNSLYGKVYVASPDSPFLTIIRTDQDIVDTTVLVSGNVTDVRVSTQDANKGNAVNTSRIPGGGQPCYLPGTTNSATLTACQTHP
jgi:hypothetical protein